MALVERDLYAALMVGVDPPDVLDLFPLRPAWTARAACRGHDQRAFFHSRDEVSDVARETCGRCPVAGPCPAYALAEDLEST
ncbi:MAG TPA: WhiB family transcriptional regulator [Acidimicrobiales bacterium]|nr:WhiB family transcriptional regulator [Acidimicrobiales bacterium]